MTPADKARIEEIRAREIRAREAREWWIDDLTGIICGPWSEIGELPWPDNEKVHHAIDYEEHKRVLALVEKQAAMIGRARNAIRDEHECACEDGRTCGGCACLTDLDRMERGE